MNELALFAGRGGGILASKLLGWNTVCAVEYDEKHRNCLLQRQSDGAIDRFPIWDDVATFDGKSWRGKINIISGGFPCQDISSAGKGAGITGERSGLWKEYARIIGEVRPEIVFAENSPNLRTRGLDVILKDLYEMGYDARWGVLGAWHFGFKHKGIVCGLLPSPSGVNGGRNHIAGRLDEWGGSSNPFRRTEIASLHLPRFEEWMMGWPETWGAQTGFEMDKYQSWLQMHSEF